ncbi:MAG: xanthine dehydrogenase family protein molybdopterin-binding subunit, partial [Candidatus Eremiobacteraeota bacterium]|nr:xanthine dehydrogenase family protein molybdopterin-binding subunit [Candidatus Eremiobacteraeota bacterium]
MKRAEFIRAGAIAGGGLLVAADVVLAGKAALAAGGAAGTPWVAITPDNVVTIMSPQSEMGQGVMTSIPMLVAEELDCDWSAAKIVQSPTEAAFNHPFFGTMATGGSTSVRAFFLPARKVGASARAMLVAAAAQQWNVAAADCRTENNYVFHDPSGKKASYGSLAAAAAAIAPPTDVALKPRERWKLLGKPTPRVDARAKSTGKAIFGIDVRVPGMMFAAVRHCPVFGGTVASINEASLAKYKWPHHVVNLKNAVAVVSDRTWRARTAAEALDVKWNPGPAATLNDAQIAAMFRAGLSENGKVAKSAGDPDAALKSAAKVVKAEYRVPYLAHATMEPMNCTASVTADSCEIWAPTQNPGNLPQLAAQITGLPAEKVSVHTTFLGGGFGRRFNFDYPAQAVAVSKAIGKPVQILWSREEDIQHDQYRPASLAALTAGLDANGNLVAWRQRIVQPSIVGQNPGLQMLFNLKPGQADPTSVEGSAEI